MTRVKNIRPTRAIILIKFYSERNEYNWVKKLTFSSGDLEVDVTTGGDVDMAFLCCAMFLKQKQQFVQCSTPVQVKFVHCSTPV